MIRPYIKKGVKGPAYIIVPLSEGSHVDRATFNFFIHVLYNRPCESTEEVIKAGDLHLECSDLIMKILKRIKVEVSENLRKFELKEVKEWVATN